MVVFRVGCCPTPPAQLANLPQVHENEPVSDDWKAILEAVRQQDVEAHAETRRLFQTTAESLRHEIRVVAEGVTQTREDVTRETASIRDEVRRTAGETQAMIKFSHAELDRRMRALEETQRSLEDTIADLQVRVERLESSTH